MAVTTQEILTQITEQFTALASLARQLIAAKAEDQSTIADLTAKADQYLQQYNETLALANGLQAENEELVTSQSASLSIAESLNSEIAALLAEASAAVSQPAPQV